LPLIADLVRIEIGDGRGANLEWPGRTPVDGHCPGLSHVRVRLVVPRLLDGESESAGGAGTTHRV